MRESWSWSLRAMVVLAACLLAAGPVRGAGPPPEVSPTEEAAASAELRLTLEELAAPYLGGGSPEPGGETAPGGAGALGAEAEAFLRLFGEAATAGKMIRLPEAGGERPLRLLYRDPSCGEISLPTEFLAVGVAELDGSPDSREIVILAREKPGEGERGGPPECRVPSEGVYALYVFAVPDPSRTDTPFPRFRFPYTLTASPPDPDNPVVIRDLDGNGREEIWMAAYRTDGERWRKYSLLAFELSDGSLERTHEFSAKSAGQDSILTLQGETLSFQVGYRYWVSKTFVEVGRIDVLGGEEEIRTELKGFE